MLPFRECKRITFHTNICLLISCIIFSTLPGTRALAAPGPLPQTATVDVAQASHLGTLKRYQVLEDQQCAQQLDEARHSPHWTSVADRSPNFGFTGACWWIRFKLENSQRQAVPLTIDLGTPLQDYVDWHVVDRADGRLLTSVRSGDRRDFNFRYQKSLTLSLPLTIAAGQQLDVYARLASFDGFQEPLAITVQTSDVFLQEKSRENLLTGMYFGCLLAFCIYSVFLFISTREKIHIIYAAFLGLLIMTTCVYYGVSAQFINPGQPDFNNPLLPFSFALCMFFFFVFAKMHLKLANQPPDILMGTYNVVTLLLLLISPLAFLLGHAAGHAANAILVLFNIAILLLLTVRLCRHKNTNAIFLLIAFFPLGTSLSLKLLSLDNIVTFQPLFERNFYLAESTIFSVVALSFSIAHSLKMMRRLMEQAKSRELESTIALQDNELKLLHLSRVTLAGELCGAIAHELSQPLTVILSNAQAAEFMLKNRHLNESAQLAITRDIIDQAKLAATVITKIRRLLYPGKRATGRIPVNDVLASARKFLQHDLLLKNIRLSEYGDHALSISGDLVQIQQVMINLLTNAIEAVKDQPEERKCIYLSVRRYLGKYALFTVSDTGVGLPPEHQDKIFDAFYTTREGGMGLGLNICKKIVVAHYGEIWARASYPFGSIVEFTIPTDE